MTSLVKVTLTQEEYDKLVEEVKESVDFVKNFKITDYIVKETVPTWFGLFSKEVKSYDTKRLRDDAPRYVSILYYSFEHEHLYIDLSKSASIIQNIVKMALAGDELYLTPDYVTVLNKVLGRE